jgi:hypothetical protein
MNTRYAPSGYVVDGKDRGKIEIAMRCGGVRSCRMYGVKNSDKNTFMKPRDRIFSCVVAWDVATTKKLHRLDGFSGILHVLNATFRRKVQAQGAGGTER